MLFPLPVADWPELDRERWQAARAPADFLEDPKLASGWSPARRRIVEQAYGQFLAFLNRNGALDPLCAPRRARDRDPPARLPSGAPRPRHPSERRHDDRGLAAYPVGARSGAGLDGTGQGLQPPQANRGAIARQAGPPGERRDLFELGLRLMDSRPDAAAEPNRPGHRAAPGLRRGVGPPQACRGGDQVGATYLTVVPAKLNPAIDLWLEIHRPNLQLIARSGGQIGGIGGKPLAQPLRPADAQRCHQAPDRTAHPCESPGDGRAAAGGGTGSIGCWTWHQQPEAQRAARTVFAGLVRPAA